MAVETACHLYKAALRRLGYFELQMTNANLRYKKKHLTGEFAVNRSWKVPRESAKADFVGVAVTSVAGRAWRGVWRILCDSNKLAGSQLCLLLCVGWVALGVYTWDVKV
jgi:hypothetical protein